MTRSFNEQEKEEIRKRLLDLGLKYFSTYGFKKTNVDEIARAAGISKGAFYRFYSSKEMLFMDVMEQVEVLGREEIMKAISLPGPTPRARLFGILKTAFDLFRELPIMHFFSAGDFGVLLHQVPADKFREHISSDQGFFEQLLQACREDGIPVKVGAPEIVNMLYPLVIAFLTDTGTGEISLTANIDGNLELLAAFCLGEVTLQYQLPGAPVLDEKEGKQE
jgi:AcrR family transcriptional regulator